LGNYSELAVKTECQMVYLSDQTAS